MEGGRKTQFQRHSQKHGARRYAAAAPRPLEDALRSATDRKLGQSKNRLLLCVNLWRRGHVRAAILLPAVLALVGANGAILTEADDGELRARNSHRRQELLSRAGA